MEGLRSKLGELRKIRVLFVSDTFVPRVDGVVRFIKEVTKRLPKGIFEIYFLAPKLHGSEDAAKKLHGKKVYLCPTTRFRIEEFPITRPKYDMIRKAVDNCDIVFINSMATIGASALIYASSVKKPIVTYAHAIDWELLAYATKFPNKAAGLLKPIVRKMYDKVDLILAANTQVIQKYKSNGIKGPFKVVELGVDLKKFKPDLSNRVRMRKKLNLTRNYVVGYHGRLSREKNIETLYKAFKLVKLHIPNAKLLIVGDGPERTILKGSDDVVLTGFVDNPEDYLNVMDVYILPSKTETTGLSLMEAMASGLPVIASAVGTIPSYVEDKKNGILIHPKDVSAAVIAKAVRAVYSDPAGTQKMKDFAVKTVTKFYSWDTTAKKLEHIFKHIV